MEAGTPILQIPVEQIDKEITWIEEIGQYLIHNESKTFLVPLICRHEGIPLPRLLDGESCVRCSRHGWILDVSSNSYVNPPGLKQLESAYQCSYIDGVITIYEPKIHEPTPPLLNRHLNHIPSNNNKVETFFVNHACFVIRSGEISLVTDPWLLGGAFCTGWFLKYPSSQTDVEEILKAGYCYISHSHPDHLNPLTLLFLKELGWDPTFIVPIFPQKDLSVEMLRSIGFAHIIELKNREIYTLDADSDFVLQMILDLSGRNDSSILIKTSNGLIYNQVDCPSPDLDGLEDIDLALLPFANGASGYPVCWEKLFGKDQIKSIKSRTNLASRNAFHQNASRLKAPFVIPFAGYFKTPLPEDRIIDDLNSKNSPDDVSRNNDKASFAYSVVDPCKGNSFKTSSGLGFTSVPRLNCESENSVFAEYRNLLHARYADFSSSELIDFLSIQEYKDPLLVRIIATDIDHDSPIWMVDWDFMANRLVGCESSLAISAPNLDLFPSHRFLEISVRAYALGFTIRNSLPWEEFSIGFQARFFRIPDVYNFGFWNYFQNELICNAPVLSDFVEFWNSCNRLRNLCSTWMAIQK